MTTSYRTDDARLGHEQDRPSVLVPDRWHALASIGSADSILAIGSIASLASVGSIASLGSIGSIASIGSVGSIASTHRVGAILNIPVAERLSALLGRRIRAGLAARRDADRS